MAYFANGYEGMVYQDKYCARCIHDVNQDCPIILLHLIWNAEALHPEGVSGDKALALNTLIPRSKDGTDNDQCKMFAPLPDTGKPISPAEERAKLAAWNAGRGIPPTAAEAHQRERERDYELPANRLR